MSGFFRNIGKYGASLVKLALYLGENSSRGDIFTILFSLSSSFSLFFCAKQEEEEGGTRREKANTRSKLHSCSPFHADEGAIMLF